MNHNSRPLLLILLTPPGQLYIQHSVTGLVFSHNQEITLTQTDTHQLTCVAWRSPGPCQTGDTVASLQSEVLVEEEGELEVRVVNSSLAPVLILTTLTTTVLLQGSFRPPSGLATPARGRSSSSSARRRRPSRSSGPTMAGSVSPSVTRRGRPTGVSTVCRPRPGKFSRTGKPIVSFSINFPALKALTSRLEINFRTFFLSKVQRRAGWEMINFSSLEHFIFTLNLWSFKKN